MALSTAISSPGRYDRPPAFSLIELVVVLAVMGIMLLLALPDMESSGRTYLLQSAANQVMAALRFAQARSINTGTQHGCEFSTADNTLRCFEVTGSPPYPTVDHPEKKTPYATDFDTAPGFGGVAITNSHSPRRWWSSIPSVAPTTAAR